jgi:hypothetical protein
MNIRETIRKIIEEPTEGNEKHVVFKDREFDELYEIDGVDLFEDMPEEFDSLDELEEYAQKIYSKLIYHGTVQEASVSGGIVGYQAPLGSNPAKSKNKNVFHTEDDSGARTDDDNKIRNLGSENTAPYVKRHPIDKKVSKP